MPSRPPMSSQHHAGPSSRSLSPSPRAPRFSTDPPLFARRSHYVPWPRPSPPIPPTRPAWPAIQPPPSPTAMHPLPHHQPTPSPHRHPIFFLFINQLQVFIVTPFSSSSGITRPPSLNHVPPFTSHILRAEHESPSTVQVIHQTHVTDMECPEHDSAPLQQAETTPRQENRPRKAVSSASRSNSNWMRLV
mgnify:CR=1 FL=1